jgi:hypothetical protein
MFKGRPMMGIRWAQSRVPSVCYDLSLGRGRRCSMMMGISNRDARTGWRGAHMRRVVAE